MYDLAPLLNELPPILPLGFGNSNGSDSNMLPLLNISTESLQPQPFQATGFLQHPPPILDLLTASQTTAQATSQTILPETIEDLTIQDIKANFQVLVTRLAAAYSGDYLNQLLSNLQRVMESKEQNSFLAALLDFLESKINQKESNLGQALDFINACASFLGQTQLNDPMWPHLIQLLIQKKKDSYIMPQKVENKIIEIIAREKRNKIHPLVVFCAAVRKHLNFWKAVDLECVRKIYQILEKVGLDVKEQKQLDIFNRLVKTCRNIEDL